MSVEGPPQLFRNFAIWDGRGDDRFQIVSVGEIVCCVTVSILSDGSLAKINVRFNGTPFFERRHLTVNINVHCCTVPQGPLHTSSRPLFQDSLSCWQLHVARLLFNGSRW